MLVVVTRTASIDQMSWNQFLIPSIQLENIQFLILSMYNGFTELFHGIHVGTNIWLSEVLPDINQLGLGTRCWIWQPLQQQNWNSASVPVTSYWKFFISKHVLYDIHLPPEFCPDSRPSNSMSFLTYSPQDFQCHYISLHFTSVNFHIH